MCLEVQFIGSDGRLQWQGKLGRKGGRRSAWPRFGQMNSSAQPPVRGARAQSM